MQDAHSALQSSNWIDACRALSVIQQLAAHHQALLASHLCVLAHVLCPSVQQLACAVCVLVHRYVLRTHNRNVWGCNKRLHKSAQDSSSSARNTVSFVQGRAGAAHGQTYSQSAQPTEQGLLAIPRPVQLGLLV
jgi:hypothetical protein